MSNSLERKIKIFTDGMFLPLIRKYGAKDFYRKILDCKKPYKELFRIVNYKDPVTRLKNGGKITYGLISTTRDEDCIPTVMDSANIPNDELGGVIIFDDCLGYDISYASVYKAEKEVMTAGEFILTKVDYEEFEDYDGNMIGLPVFHLKQNVNDLKKTFIALEKESWSKRNPKEYETYHNQISDNSWDDYTDAEIQL